MSNITDALTDANRGRQAAAKGRRKTVFMAPVVDEMGSGSDNDSGASGSEGPAEAGESPSEQDVDEAGPEEQKVIDFQ
jgi:hypothetical protein